MDGNGSSTPIVWGNQVFLLTALNTGKIDPSLPKPEDQPKRVFGIKYFNQSNTGILSCLDAKTGDAILDRTRLLGVSNLYASPVGASGRVDVTARDGTTLVLERSSKLNLLATNEPDDQFDSSAALAGNQLFLRGAKFLYCIAEDEQTMGSKHLLWRQKRRLKASASKHRDRRCGRKSNCQKSLLISHDGRAFLRFATPSSVTLVPMRFSRVRPSRDFSHDLLFRFDSDFVRS